MTEQDVMAFLRLLEKAPASRRKWRVLECHCRACGDLAIEVFRTPTDFASLVAIHFGLKAQNMEPGKLYPFGLQHKGIRASAPTVSVLQSTLQDDLEVACKCGKRQVPVSTLLATVREKRRKVVLDTPTVHS